MKKYTERPKKYGTNQLVLNFEIGIKKTDKSDNDNWIEFDITKAKQLLNYSTQKDQAQFIADFGSFEFPCSSD